MGAVTLMSSNVIQCPAETAVAEAPNRMIEALARAMNARDGFTHAHAQRVQRFAAALAGAANIRDHRLLEALDAAALLHDIGKLGIPDQLLHKPGPLTADEYAQVKQHAVIGADILSAMPFPGPLALIVRHHHENWDGTGYPDGLRGDAIPLGARVLAIVDCYDALTSDRPYRRSLSHERATAMILERRGTMYEPEIADAFLRIVAGLHQAPDRERAGAAPTRASGPRRLARVI
jgi:putative nucleotidyltransferase with HDIG domain